MAVSEGATQLRRRRPRLVIVIVPFSNVLRIVAVLQLLLPHWRIESTLRKQRFMAGKEVDQQLVLLLKPTYINL